MNEEQLNNMQEFFIIINQDLKFIKVSYDKLDIKMKRLMTFNEYVTYTLKKVEISIVEGFDDE